MRLIDALQEFQWNYFINCIYDCCNELGATDNISANCLIDCLSNMEINAVPVVRCKDCVNGTVFVNKQREEYVDCVLDDYSVRKPTDYCSYGKRKEGAD